MITIDNYIEAFSRSFDQRQFQPWEIIQDIETFLMTFMANLDDDFVVEDSIAIHKTAVIEDHVTLKPPVVIGENCFVGANAYLRNGVYLGKDVKIGTGCELKSSLIFDKSRIAHFNFIGDSIIGSSVNFEAGSITANHFNERADKDIYVLFKDKVINTRVHKYGALVGDGTKIGANAVLSPGTLLEKDSTVKRLALIEQVHQD